MIKYHLYLQSRIHKAIDFYWKQAAVNTPPTIIFSGGQGPDEGLPEAEAMQKYAVEKGIPLEHTVQEKSLCKHISKYVVL